MDTVGCLISATLLLGVFVVFGVIGRIVDGAIAEIRYTIAPEVVSGVRAWEASRDASAPVPTGPRPDDTGDGADPAGSALVVAVGQLRPDIRAIGRHRASPVTA